MKYALVFLCLFGLVSTAYADPEIHRVQDEFEDAEFVFTMGGKVEVDEGRGILSLDYGAAIGSDGTIQGYVIMVVYGGDDWLFAKDIRLRADDEPALTLICHKPSRKVQGNGITERCIVDTDRQTVEAMSKATKIRIGFGPVRGTADSSAAVLLLEQLKESPE